LSVSHHFFLILQLLKKVRHIINYTIWSLVGLYLALIAVVNIPMTQHFIGDAVASALSRKFGTAVSVGRVSLGFFNRIIIDDVSMLDQQHHHLFRATRLSAKFSYLDLMQGRFTIVSAQIFGMDANLYKATAQSKPNYQFFIDSLSSKDTTQHKPLYLNINSLILRRGKIAYNQLDAPKRQGFDTHHLSITDISSHVMIHVMGDDSLGVSLRNLTLNEGSGLQLTGLRLRAMVTPKSVSLNDFRLSLPHSEILIPSIAGTYHKPQTLPSLALRGRLEESHVYLPDLAWLIPALKNKPQQVVVNSRFTVKDQLLTVGRLSASLVKCGFKPSMKSPGNMRLEVSGDVAMVKRNPRWHATIRQLSIDGEGMQLIAGHVPDALTRLNDLSFRGNASGRGGNDVAVGGHLVSGAGEAKLALNKTGDLIKGFINTDGFSIGRVLNNDKLGLIAARINGEGNLKQKHFAVKGHIGRIDYNGYSYRNITADAQADGKRYAGKLSINDPNADASVEGIVDLEQAIHCIHLTADINHITPSRLKLFTGKLADADYRASLSANISGNDLNHATGEVNVNRFSMASATQSYALDSLRLKAGTTAKGHYVVMHSDFGSGLLYGPFDYRSLAQSVENVIVRKLPSIVHLVPFRYRPVSGGGFSVAAVIHKADWAKAFFNIPVQLADTLRLTAQVSAQGNTVDAQLRAPCLYYGDRELRNVSALVETIDGKLHAKAALRNMVTAARGTDLSLDMLAGNDQLQASLDFDNHATAQRFHGQLRSQVSFDETADDHSEAVLELLRSQFHVGDTLFEIRPSTLTYSKKHLAVNNFYVGSDHQSIRLDGVASASPNDSITATLNHVNVPYILNLVNFHSVDFGGAVTGFAHIKQLFDKPDIGSQLRVDNFMLEGGRLGTLFANARWNTSLGQIDIDAEARDTVGNNPLTIKPRTTIVKGYVSPKRGDIDLDMQLHETRAEFVGNICSSFLDNFNVSASGNLRLWGSLKKLNLTGDVIAHGTTDVKPLGTTYSLHDADVKLTEDAILFDNDTITDRYQHHGILSGAVHHQHLSRWNYDIDVSANNLLAFDTHADDGSSFYGRVFGTGSAAIKGGSGNVTIDVNVTPDKNSEIVYDISSPEAVGAHDFIHWASRDSLSLHIDSLRPMKQPDDDGPDIPTDIYISFLINTTPDATLRIIMDKTTNDYITLNGSGALRTNWFNKGGIDIFGTYNVDHGVYKLTIQNIIKKVFNFAQGGTIVFGGNPMAAQLNLSAVYPIASVSLSDLEIGRSFSSNNTRVNCLMNISGTPEAPKVDFNLDFPSLDADAKQMIVSRMNSEEQINQQVLYLLAVGRFYMQGTNNASEQGYNQTSLAMQSLLSGQISQQINNVLGSLTKNNQWNFGANISTGDEGWNNAEYEGLLSGSLLNNRLLLNGQFGYRDNANATQSFIGDFDVRYLIFPNGNFSVHVYNKTNDRYFTRNSLNTQGIGFILKKDFNSLSDLFRWSGRKSHQKEK